MTSHEEKEKILSRLEEILEISGGNNPTLKREVQTLTTKLKDSETLYKRRYKLSEMQSVFNRLLSNKELDNHNNIRGFVRGDISVYRSLLKES